MYGSADLEFQGKKRKTRREVFLERMDGLIPWPLLEDRIRPFYPKAGRGRQPYPLSVMLRVHCVQPFCNLSDPGMKDLLYESEPVRRFVGLKLSGSLPDETTMLNFRHLLKKNSLGQGLLEEINAHLESQGLRLREGTIVDATIIEAPSSTKNRAGDRDPEMRQTKKGNQWHFGMKIHIGVDADTGLVHSMSTTAANAHDITEAHHLLHGGGKVVWCRRVSGGSQTGGEPGVGAGMADGDASAESAEAGAWESGVLGGEAEGVGKGQEPAPTAIGGGASLPEGEAGVQLREGTLPGLGQEHAASGVAAGTGQPDDSGASTGGLTWRPAGPNPSVGRLGTRYSPAGGEITGQNHR